MQRLSTSEVNKAYVALDLMRSIFSAHDGEIPDEETLAVLPVEAWRKNTVAVPAAFLRILAEGWGDYIEQQKIPSGKTLGQCLDLEAKFQGNIGSAKKMRTIDKRQRYANLVILEILKLEVHDKKYKLDAIINLVAANERVSESTIKNAYRKLGRLNLDEIRLRLKTS